MVSRTMWSEALDEDDPGAVTGPAIDQPEVADTAADDDAAYRRKRLAAGLILAGVALLLFLLLGWWMAHRGDADAGAAPAAQSAEMKQPAGSSLGTDPGTGVTAAGIGTLARQGTGDTPDGSGGSGATGGKAGSGDTGTGGHHDPATAAGGGSGGGSGGGGGGSGGGGGTGTTADTPLVSAKVDAGVTSSGVEAGVDLGVATSRGGAVTSVVVTSCVKTGAGLSNALDTRATVTWGNGYQDTDVKVSGLNLLNLLNPSGLKVTSGGAPVSVPSNATVKVGLCLGL